MQTRVAVLVDADNISPKFANQILKLGRSLGRADFLRCYLNAQKSSPWLTQPDFRVFHAGAGKNGADLLLAIDAIELALTAKIDTFVLASSDSDFSHLAHRLREMGLHVHGVGEEKAPPGFRAACTGFTQVGPATKPKESPTVTPTPAPQPQQADSLDQNILSLIAINSNGGKGMLLTELSPQMHQKHGIKISTYKEKTWRAYFLARPHLYDLDPRGQQSRVRFRPEGFAAMQTPPLPIPALASPAPSR